MRNIKAYTSWSVISTSLLLVIGLMLCSTVDVYGQRNRQKIGYVDTNYILEKLPEYNGLDQRLDLKVKEWNEAIQEKEKELADLKTEFEAKEILFTEKVKDEKQKKMDLLEKEIARMHNQYFGPEGDYFKEQQKLLEPIQRKVFEAIETVARRENYTTVLDRAGELVILFSDPDWDISNLVLEELGIDVEELSN